MKIPSFHGKSDREAYIEWERKMELVFDLRNYFELQKVNIAQYEFTYYAIVQLDQLCIESRLCGEGPIETGNEMKRIMRLQFIMGQYYSNPFVQGIHQGSQIVDV